MTHQSFRISELALQVGGRVVGNGDALVERVSALEDADERSVVFIEDARQLVRLIDSRAGCCITPELEHVDLAMPRLEVGRPKLAFAKVGGLLHPEPSRPPAVHPTAVVASSARVHPTVHIGPHVSVGEHAELGEGTRVLPGVRIGDDVRVGRHCVIHPNVVLYAGVTLGDRVILHAGAVVGADGFGYVRDADGYVKFPQIGSVVIGDDVEVGANSCIDRGALGSTRVGRGTKIDDLVMIAHNVQIGERTIMAGQVGISGSARIEDDVVLAGQVGLADHVTVRQGVQIGAKSAVFPGKIIPRGAVVMGIPARPLDRYKEVSAHLARLPQFRAELHALRQEVARLRGEIKTLSAGSRADASEGDPPQPPAGDQP